LKDQYLIIVAGGSGSRMNSDVPKQFMEINGEAMIVKTLRCFLNYNISMQIIICVHPAYKTQLQELLDKSGLTDADIQITEGGNTRFDSVKNGLELLNDKTGVVGIHDAARPFVSLQTIKNCFETADSSGNAIPCIGINESLRKIDGSLSHAVNRDAYKIVQTPQCFLISEIKIAFEQDYNPKFTDDATVLESTGKKINLVVGNIENIKITSPSDLQMAKYLSDYEQR